jgi:hypothetical protein
MRGIVIAKMIGLALLGLYLAIGLTQPPGDEKKANTGDHELQPLSHGEPG